MATTKKLNITPVAGSKNRVIVKAAEAETKTAGGIIIPDTAKEKPSKGIVLALSAKDEDGNQPTVKVGDTVLYGRFAGTDIQIDGQDLLIMRESDILAII